MSTLDRGAGGRTRMPLARSYPKVVKLKHKGLTNKEVARELGKSERAIEWILHHGKKAALEGLPAGATIVQDPLEVHLLTEQAKRCLEPTADGFERFFNRYSGWKLAKHSKRFVETALANPMVLINTSVGHAKSKCFAVWFPLWRICQDRNIQIVLISKTRSLALKSGREICGHMESNMKLIEDFGRFKPDEVSARWSPSMGEFMVAGRNRLTQTGDLTLLCAGVGQFIYGIRADLIVGDDLVDEENSSTQSSREKLEEWFHVIVETRLAPEGKATVIGTRFHMADLYGHLASLESSTRADEHGAPIRMWEHINFPAVLDWGTHEVLWPEFWPWEKLMARRDMVGSREFDRAYQQLPIASEDRIVEPEWIEACSDLDRSWGPQARNGARVVSLDPSPSQFAGIVVADVSGTLQNYRISVCESQRRKMKVADMLDELDRLHQAYHFEWLIIEINAAQRWFLENQDFQAWRRRLGVKVIPHTTSRNKADSRYGTQSLGPDFEAGFIRLPAADQASRQAVAPLVQGALQATADEKDSDDCFMALWFIKWNLRRLLPFAEAPKSEPIQTSFHVPRRLQGRPFAWTSRR